jgi:antitoxin MazE
MLVKVKKWGNSLAVRIPSVFAKAMGLCPDAEVELRLEGGRLLIIPDRKKCLEDLVEKISSENIHGEVDWGENIGKEEW